MSHVSNVILTFSIVEDSTEQDDGPDDYPVLAPLNAWLAERQYGRHLAEVGQHAGGCKRFESPLYAIALNYVGTQEFMDVVNALPWKYPEEVQVWVQGQHDDLFTEYRVWRSPIGQPEDTP
jgi:hypothetical protein